MRELENCLERAVLTAQGDCVHSHNLPPSLKPGHHQEMGTGSETGGGLSARLDSYERELLVKALEKYSGNMSAAARELGISPRVMHYKVRRLELIRFLAAGERGSRPGKPGRRAASKPISNKA